MKIAHIVRDEKFPDSAYSLFESVVPGGNHFLLLGPESKLKYIKEAPVSFEGKGAHNKLSFFRKLRSYEFVVLHSLGGNNSKLLKNAPKDIRFIWIGMGYDYYDLICDAEALYLEKTKKLAKEIMPLRQRLKEPVKAILQRFADKRSSLISLLARVDYFAPVLEVEYDVISRNFSGRMPPYVDWNYGMTSSAIEKLHGAGRLEGDDILLGNSATLTNNHLEAMEQLAKMKLHDRRIVCPLSYGNQKYADRVESVGRSLFGHNFLPIRSFMSQQDYLDLVSGCSNVIMNHMRQQAGSNIAIMLYRGAKVFLRKGNPLYDYYLGAGVRIFLLESLLEDPGLLSKPLSDAEVEQNKNIVAGLWSRDVLVDKTRRLIDIVLQKNGHNVESVIGDIR